MTIFGVFQFISIGNFVVNVALEYFAIVLKNLCIKFFTISLCSGVCICSHNISAPVASEIGAIHEGYLHPRGEGIIQKPTHARRQGGGWFVLRETHT